MALEVSLTPAIPQAAPVPVAVEAKEWVTPGRFAAVLLIFICAAYPDVVFGRNTFYFRDFGYFGYPLAHYFRESVWRGELPFWNPLNNCGLPFMAQWNTMVFYPGSLFYLLLPLTWALGVFCLAHLFLGGLGMYWLAYRWTQHRLSAGVAGLSYACSGLLLNSLMWPNNIAALGLMPWVLHWVECGWRQGGRKLWLAGFLGAAQMLTGAPEIILFTWVLLSLMLAGELTIGRIPRSAVCLRFCLLVVCVAGLSAVQLLPFLDLLRHSQRSQGFANADWSMPETGWANLLVPLFHTYQNRQGVFFQYGQYWTSSYYVGIGVLALAICAAWRLRTRRVWLLGFVTLLSLILALGDNGYLYGWVRKAIPQAGFMRFPVKFVVLATLCLPLLAAFGVRAVAQDGGRAWVTTLRISAIFLLLSGAILTFGYFYPLPGEEWKDTWQSGASRAGILFVMLATLFAMRRALTERSQILSYVVLLVLVGVDGLTHVPRQNPTVERPVFEPGLQVLQELTPLPAHGHSRAMLTPEADMKLRYTFTSTPRNDYIVNRAGLFSNCNLLDNVPKLNGFYSLYLREADDVRKLIYEGTNGPLPVLYDFLGVSQITRPGEYFEWTNRTTFLPFVTAGQAPVFLDDQAALRKLAGPDFCPKEEVMLPLEAEAHIRAKGGAQIVVLSSHFQPHAGRITVNAREAGLVVVAQAYYHPWKAYVDGQPTRLWRANHGFQAFEVPAGKHELRLVYEDQQFRIGAAISGVTLLGCVGMLGRRSNERRVSPAQL
jgi:hypothetical protein